MDTRFPHQNTYKTDIDSQNVQTVEAGCAFCMSLIHRFKGTKWLETRVLAFSDATIDDSLAFWPLGMPKTRILDASKGTDERQSRILATWNAQNSSFGRFQGHG